MKKQYLFLCLTICMTFASHVPCAWSKNVVRMSITKQVGGQMVVLLPDGFSKSGEHLKVFQSALTRGLWLFSQFKLVTHAQVTTSARQEGFDKFSRRNWGSIEGDILIKFELSETLGVLSATYHVWEYNQQQLMFKGTVRGSKKSLVDMGLEAAEKIIKSVSGKTGQSLSRIAFVSDHGGQKTIYDTDVSGQDTRKLVHQSTLAISPEWGKDRQTLIYTSYQNINPHIFMKNLTTNKVEVLSNFPGLNANAKINQQNEIVFTASRDGNPEIYRKNILTGKAERVTRRHGVDASPCWSPDGREIAFVSEEHGSPQIYLMSRDGSKIRRLTYSGNYNSSPNWSPDGRYLAFCSRIDGNFSIAIYDFISRRMDLLVSHLKNAEAPAFSPDSKYVAFSSNTKSKNWNIYIVSVEEKDMVQVTRNMGNCTNPAWK